MSSLVLVECQLWRWLAQPVGVGVDVDVDVDVGWLRGVLVGVVRSGRRVWL